MSAYSQQLSYQMQREYDLRRRWEEMTLVIGLCGKDGCLLAADTKINVTKKSSGTLHGEPLHDVRYTTNCSKIFVSDKHGIMIGWAGLNVRELAAAKLKERCDSIESFSDDNDELEKTIRAACEDACTTPSNINQPQFDGQLLVVNPRSRFRPLWSARFYRHLLPSKAGGQLEGQFSCTPRAVFNKEVIGEDANSALFFLERYYAPRALSLDELLLLVGYVIRSASYLAKDWISGIEIAVCTETGSPEFIQIETLNEIWRKSESLSADIEHKLSEPLSDIRRGKTRALLNE